MFINNDLPINLKDFVIMLVKPIVKKIETEDSLFYGYRIGWLEEQDIAKSLGFIDRKTAARILHQFMRFELHEPDESNISHASKLQDLYDCRICTGHIIQVYVKGLMDGYLNANNRLIFGMNDVISNKEAIQIVKRLWDSKYRYQKKSDFMPSNIITISHDIAMLQLRAEKGILLIDVRPTHEFEKSHMADASNIPLTEILKNPYTVSPQRDKKIFLYCSEGYQSNIAAQCLLDAGYEKVFCFAWNN